MAVMRRGIIGDVSGRLGGVEFALTKGRAVVKSCKVKRSRVSGRTLHAQASQAAAVRHWETLTDAQRLAWDTASREHPVPDRFGIPRIRSGRELFMTIPHDFRFGVPEIWQDVPPKFRFEVSGLVGVDFLSSTSLIVEVHLLGSPTPTAAWVWCARWTKPYLRQHRGWMKIGPQYGPSGPLWVFDAEMAALDVEFVSGEYVALKVGAWKYNYWPWEYDLGVHVVA